MSQSHSLQNDPVFTASRGVARLAVGVSAYKVTKSILDQIVDEPETKRDSLRNSLAVYGLATAASLAASSAVDRRLVTTARFVQEVKDALVSKTQSNQDDATPA